MAYGIGRSISNEAKKELEKIREKSGGRIEPEIVVEYARSSKNPLHRYFNWDDSDAARLYRLRQAGEIIRVVVRVIPGTLTHVRAYVSLSSERKNAKDKNNDESENTIYRKVEDVISNDGMRHQMLADAIAELASFHRKYIGLSEMANVMKAIGEFLKKKVA